MKSKSNLSAENRDGKESQNIGKELSLAHKLFCRIRASGATAHDMKRLLEVSDAHFDHLLASARDVLPDHLWEYESQSELVNLDRDPEFDLSKGCNEISLIEDNRLGVWLLEDGLVLGGNKVAIVKGFGKCFNRGAYHQPGVDPNKARQWVHLNYQAAKWLMSDYNPDRTHNLFESIGDGEIKEEKIFFLGTVWKYRRADSKIYAPAIVMAADGSIELKQEPIPEGAWPKDSYLAVLVPKK